MKKIIISFGFALFSLALSAQDIAGNWTGVLDAPGAQLKIVLHISKTDKGYEASIDSPDQGATGIPVTTTSFVNDTLKFSIEDLQASYEAVLTKEKIIKGTLTQNGMVLPLSFARMPEENKNAAPAKGQ